jgi:polar amino acid transport system substrate-binding protein
MKTTTLNRLIPANCLTWLAVVVLGFVAVQVAWSQQEEESEAAAAPETDTIVPDSPATTLERIQASGILTMGYRDDARPFSFQDESGNPGGYTVALCGYVLEHLKAELERPDLSVRWVPVTAQGGLDAVADGSIDLLCGATSETLSRRSQVSFSIPVFPGGIGAVVRKDSPERLRLVLEGRQAPKEPTWRGAPAPTLQHRQFSVVAGTTAETWLHERIAHFGLLATVVPVDSYQAGVQRVVDRESEVMFGEWAVLLDTARELGAAEEVMAIDRLFMMEPIALVLPRGDEDFRLSVDRTLSNLYGTPGFIQVYSGFFGEPNETMAVFLGLARVPD